MTKVQSTEGSIQGYPSQGKRNVSTLITETDVHSGMTTVFFSSPQERGAPSKLCLSPAMRAQLARELSKPIDAPDPNDYRLVPYYDSVEEYAEGQEISLDRAQRLWRAAHSDS